jgi:hypothetical protein
MTIALAICTHQLASGAASRKPQLPVTSQRLDDITATAVATPPRRSRNLPFLRANEKIWFISASWPGHISLLPHMPKSLLLRLRFYRFSL